LEVVSYLECRGERYLVIVSERPRELAIYDSSDLVLYSSLWSDEMNSFMLLYVPRECREALAKSLGEAKEKGLDVSLVERAMRILLNPAPPLDG